MKYSIFILILFLGLTNLHSQRFTYNLDYKLDSLENNYKTDIFFLSINDKQSVFNSETVSLKDSILKSNNPMGIFQVPKSDFMFTILKQNDRKNIQSIYHEYSQFKFIVDEENLLDWKINNVDKKNINGYNCKKATVNKFGRNWIAWYTEEIPISDGPYKFHGLPGLILEIYDENKHYIFELLNIKKLKDDYNYVPFEGSNSKYVKITSNELNDFQQKIKENPSLIFENMGLNIPTENYNKKQIEKNKKKNNPIELK